jgi:hypothetical protein
MGILVSGKLLVVLGDGSDKDANMDNCLQVGAINSAREGGL